MSKELIRELGLRSSKLVERAKVGVSSLSTRSKEGVSGLSTRARAVVVRLPARTLCAVAVVVTSITVVLWFSLAVLQVSGSKGGSGDAVLSVSDPATTAPSEGDGAWEYE